MENRNKEKVQAIESVVNDFGFNAKSLAKDLCGMHRTLQQSFTSLCLEWLKVVASDDYRYDGRNELSHIAAKKIVTNSDDFHSLPLI